VQWRVLQELRAAPFEPGVRGVTQPTMKFFNQTRLAEPRLADDQHKLSLAVPRPLPAPHQHRHFLLATDEGRKLTQPGAASAAACPDEPEQRHWLGHSFQLTAAAFFDDEEAGDLALHLRGNQNCAGLRQGLHPCGGVGHVSVDLPRSIHHHGPGFKADAGLKFRLSDSSTLAVQVGESPLDR
jgi:hypothetical protein